MHLLEIAGTRVPSLGLGTWQLRGDECLDAVRHALSIGYRHIDTAQGYGNEEHVGKALADGGVPRDDIFLTTKVGPSRAGASDVRTSAEESLGKLQTDHVDLLLLHWPTDAVPLEETLGAMTDLVDAGLVRHVGVSNFTPSLVREAVRIAPIFANQVEYHPYLDQRTLRDLAVEHEHMLTAYSPIAQGEVLDDPVLRAIGEGHGKSPVQVTLRWLVQQPNVAAIPRSSSAANREANLDIVDFELSEEEMRRIHGLARGHRLIDPPFAPRWE
jgi:2,5-diketo-D-gluconate reductase B